MFRTQLGPPPARAASASSQDWKRAASVNSLFLRRLEL